MNKYHTSVLLQEAVEALAIHPDRRYIDATLGGGGHTAAIRARGGVVLGIDQDGDAVAHCVEVFSGDDKVTIVRANFSDIDTIASEKEFLPVDGILFDLGTSVHQIQDASRGFSFKKHELLDMRMNTNEQLTAAEIVNTWKREELIRMLESYGEEHEARLIVDGILEARRNRRIEYADELADIVSRLKKRSVGGIHPATQTFQAIRIAVNGELEVLSIALEKSVKILGKGGRLVVISFHSLEDRIVKRAFNVFATKGLGVSEAKKPILARAEELAENKKARSAKMRVFIKQI